MVGLMAEIWYTCSLGEYPGAQIGPKTYGAA